MEAAAHDDEGADELSHAGMVELLWDGCQQFLFHNVLGDRVASDGNSSLHFQGGKGFVCNAEGGESRWVSDLLPRSLHPGERGGVGALFVKNKVTGEVQWHSDLAKERAVHAWVRTVDNMAGLPAMTVSAVIRSQNVGRVGPLLLGVPAF